MEQLGRGRIRRVQISAVVTRSDGAIHDLGVISDSKWWWRLGPRLLASARIRRLNKQAGTNN